MARRAPDPQELDRPADSHVIEIDAAASGHGVLGMPPEHFLQQYWQKRPLLIRGAFPAFSSPIAPEDLAGLACEDGVLARLVSHDQASDTWQVRNGPFAEDDFPALPDHDWTVLVQDVDKWDDDVRALLRHFDFLPRWRMDDIMVSFAARGGTVGAHIDQYDVFLLQGAGRRRWQIDTRPDPDERYRDDVPLRLLRHFAPDHDWVLEPGDMLYLPPGVPHHGVAVDHCLTISIGLRAPSAAELLEDHLDTLAFDADERVRYVDPDLQLPADTNEIDDAAIDRALAAMERLRMTDRDALGRWFGRFVSGYRVAAGMAPSPETADARPMADTLAQGAVWRRHPYSRMAWRRQGEGAMLFANGMEHACPPEDAGRIAAFGRIDLPAWQTLSPAGRSLLHTLAAHGHYRLEDDDDDA